MSTQTYEPTLDAFVQRVAHEGSTYQVEEAELRHGSRAALLAEFTACRVSGDIPLFEEHRVVHDEEQEDDAVALL